MTILYSIYIFVEAFLVQIEVSSIPNEIAYNRLGEWNRNENKRTPNPSFMQQNETKILKAHTHTLRAQ